MADNTWHRTLCGIGVSEWDGKGGDPAPRDCGACADAPQPAPPAQPDPAALRALRALLRLPGLLRGQPVASDRRGERTMTTQTHVCSVAGCPQPVTLMTSLNGNPLRAYCATHGPVVYTVPAPPATPDPAALRAVLLEFLGPLLRESMAPYDATLLAVLSANLRDLKPFNHPKPKAADRCRCLQCLAYERIESAFLTARAAAGGGQ